MKRTCSIKCFRERKFREREKKFTGVGLRRAAVGKMCRTYSMKCFRERRYLFGERERQRRRKFRESKFREREMYVTLEREIFYLEREALSFF